MTTTHYHALWQEARTRFYNQLQQLTVQDLHKKLGTSPNSVGFLIRHIADVELLFTKNVFKKAGIQVTARTVIDKRDTGEWTDLAALLAYQQEAFEQLQAAILATTDWDSTITTAEFGTKTKAEALGRIVSHTAYHAGQLALALKYGN
jgi:uncharacterized damage-inducible protein DinB